MNTKPCKKCGVTDRYKGGRCRPCSKKYCIAYQQAHQEAHLERTRRYRAKYPDRCKSAIIKSRYGITEEHRKDLHKAQNGLCAICKLAFDDTQKRTKAHVDHCHITGKIRGLLCDACNVGLGRFKDNQENLKKAAEYLRQ